MEKKINKMWHHPNNCFIDEGRKPIQKKPEVSTEKQTKSFNLFKYE
jgi:hypothetical protein